MMSPERTIRVRDLATDIHVDLSIKETALRVPYDVFHLEGPARYDAGMLAYRKDGQDQQGRATEAPLGECRPGERVLLRERALLKEESGWWLCEVESINGGDIA